MLRTADQCRHAILQRDEGVERREGGGRDGLEGERSRE